MRTNFQTLTQQEMTSVVGSSSNPRNKTLIIIDPNGVELVITIEFEDEVEQTEPGN